jgi:hypothetical protein
MKSADVFTKMYNLTRFRTPDDKPILCIDFDGTISDYKAGFVSFDEVGVDSNPIPGAFELIESFLEDGYRIVIWSVRCNDLGGETGICKWLLQKGLPADVVDKLEFTPGKPNAMLFIDDRSIQFKGDWGPIRQSILDYETWYSKE